jgi:hypothetical protein
VAELRTDKNQGGDEFEARNMQDGAPVVHRDKKVARGLTAILLLAGLLTSSLGAVIGFMNGTASKPLPATALPFVVAAVVALGLVLATLGIVFAVVRTLVTERFVDVKYGLWGPRIPLENVRSCRVIEYDWKQFGGWGVRLGKDGTWAYVPSDGRVLELRYVDEGKEKRVLVGAEDADQTARQIELARERLGKRGPHLRVEDSAEDLEAAAQAEAEAAPGHEKKRG